MGEGGKRTAAILYNAINQEEINDDTLIAKGTCAMGEDENIYYHIRK